MAAQDAKSVAISFAGAVVGGVESFDLFQGQVQETTYRPLNGAPVSHPGSPDFGQCLLNLYYDADDAGQAALLSSLRGRTRHTLIVTHADGSTDTCTAFVLLFPVRGSKSAGTPIVTTRCLLRISGNVTSS